MSFSVTVSPFADHKRIIDAFANRRLHLDAVHHALRIEREREDALCLISEPDERTPRPESEYRAPRT